MIASSPYVLGGRSPARVEEPADASRVAAIVCAAAEAGEAVVAFGGSTLQSIGNAPARYDVAVSLRRLERVVQYDPRDLTIGVQAGITLAVLAQTLADSGQFIPFDAPLPHRATIGGTLAAGWAGPRRAAYGHSRDLLIGSTVALTDGSLADAGGMVVKNVTGYDMSKAYVGSLGTLGIIVRANFKALPRPAARRIAVAPLSNEVRERTLQAIEQLDVEPTAALLVDGFLERTVRVRDEASRLVMLFEGSVARIDRATRDLRSLLGKCGVAETLVLDDGAAGNALQALIDAYVEPVEDRSITYRSTGMPSDVVPRSVAGTAAAREAGASAECIADLRTGDVILRCTGTMRGAIVDRLADVDAAVRATAPKATVLAGAAALRARVDAWGRKPSTLETQRAMKQRFDPSGALAPGRYVGGL